MCTQLLLETLPADILDAMSCYLTGWDVFQLSHVNAQCWNHFSRSTFWDQHFPSLNKRLSGCNSKQSYAQTRSFIFEGLPLKERLGHCGDTDGSGGAVVQDPLTMEPFTETFTRGSSFTIDLWFSLLDGENDGILTGGVLLGGQSPLMRTCLWTNHHVAFVAVDGDCNLFCSMLDDTVNCVATRLDFGRWYHLALTYDGKVQRVCLNGELVSELKGTLHHSWRELSQVQIGTGFVSSFWRQKSSFHLDTRARSVRTFCGWQNFHGLVDEFRVWRERLNDEEILLLAQCKDRFLSEIPEYSLKHAVTDSQLKHLPCTRPSECYSLHPAKPLASRPRGLFSL